MVNYSPAAPEQLSATFAALADPTRRSILERLSRRGATVSELAEPFDMSLPAVSKHLRILERAGLLERRVQGRVHRIVIAPQPLTAAQRWLEEHRRFWEERLDALARYLEGTQSPQEAPAWRSRKSAPRRRSVSNARSRRRVPGSSRRGRGRR